MFLGGCLPFHAARLKEGLEERRSKIFAACKNQVGFMDDEHIQFKYERSCWLAWHDYTYYTNKNLPDPVQHGCWYSVKKEQETGPIIDIQCYSSLWMDPILTYYRK